MSKLVRFFFSTSFLSLNTVIFISSDELNLSLLLPLYYWICTNLFEVYARIFYLFIVFSFPGNKNLPFPQLNIRNITSIHELLLFFCRAVVSESQRTWNVFFSQIEMKNVDGPWNGSYEEFWKGKIHFCHQV